MKPERMIHEGLEEYPIQPGPLVAMWLVSIVISAPLAFIAKAFVPGMGYVVLLLGMCFYPAYSYGVYTLAKRLGSKSTPQNVAFGFAVFNFLPVLLLIVLGWMAALAKSPPLTSLTLLAVLALGSRGRVLSIQAGTGLDAQQARKIAAMVAITVAMVVGITVLITLNFFGEAMRKGGY